MYGVRREWLERGELPEFAGEQPPPAYWQSAIRSWKVDAGRLEGEIARLRAELAAARGERDALTPRPAPWYV